MVGGFSRIDGIHHRAVEGDAEAVGAAADARYMYCILTSLPANGRLFCSRISVRTLNGSQRSATPAWVASASARLTDR